MKNDELWFRLTIWVLGLFQGMVIGYAVCVQTEPSRNAVSPDPCHISVVEYSAHQETEDDTPLIQEAIKAADPDYDYLKVPPAAFAGFTAYDPNKGRWVWSNRKQGWDWVVKQQASSME